MKEKLAIKRDFNWLNKDELPARYITIEINWELTDEDEEKFKSASEYLSKTEED
jgi:hypothetical protein